LDANRDGYLVRIPGFSWLVGRNRTAFLERSKMAGDTSGDKTRVREFKEQLVKAARMYAMCRKAGITEPMDVTGLAVAAFEDMPLKQALVFVRTNEQNIEDLAWAFSNSRSAEEFEQRVKELKNLLDPKGGSSSR
jgi:hypothetical protein